MIYILRGLPGVGKTFWQKEHHPRAEVVSANHFFEKEGKYAFNGDRLEDAHAECMLKFINTLASDSGEDIVVDNTNISAIEIAPYMSVAKAFKQGTVIVNIIPPRAWKTYLTRDCNEALARRCVHDVPLDTIARMHKSIRLTILPPFWPRKTVHSSG